MTTVVLEGILDGPMLLDGAIAQGMQDTRKGRRSPGRVVIQPYPIEPQMSSAAFLRKRTHGPTSYA